MRYSLTDLATMRGETDWARVDRLSDAEIEAAIAADPDASPIWTEEDFARARVVEPPPKEMISIRLDRDVLAWFRSLGPGYQTRINLVLRGAMKAARERR